MVILIYSEYQIYSNVISINYRSRVEIDGFPQTFSKLLQSQKSLSLKMSSQQTLNGCSSVARIHYTTYGIIAVTILPVTFWGVYKHIQFHSSQISKNKSLNRLTMCLYLCTILSLVFTTITSFGACILANHLWHLSWNIQTAFWMLQWFSFIFILFSRFNIYVLCHCLCVYFEILLLK